MSSFFKVIGLALMGLGMLAAVSLLFAVPFMLLWDWLMPAIFGLKEITLLQAWGLPVLFGCFFGPSRSKVTVNQ